MSLGAKIYEAVMAALWTLYYIIIVFLPGIAIVLYFDKWYPPFVPFACFVAVGLDIATAFYAYKKKFIVGNANKHLDNLFGTKER